MCAGVVPTEMSVHHVHAAPMEAQRGHWVPLNWSYRHQLPCGCPESNLDPLEEWPVLLAAEPLVEPGMRSSFCF